MNNTIEDNLGDGARGGKEERMESRKKIAKPGFSILKTVIIITSLWFIVVVAFSFLSFFSLFSSGLFASRPYSIGSGFVDRVRSVISVDPSSECYKEIEGVSIVSLPEPEKNSRLSCDDMVKALNDKYSDYFTDQEYDDFTRGINNEYSGIGLILGDKKQGEPAIVEKVIKEEAQNPEDIPSVKNDIRVGDMIESVDGKETSSLVNEEVTKLIKGKEGTSVKLVIKRSINGSLGLIEKNIIRKKITLLSIRKELVGKTLYIYLNSFSENAYNDILASIQSVGANNFDRLILDLRDNPGGYLESAVDVSSLFVPNNTVVIKEKTKNQDKEIRTSKEQVIFGKKVVVVVNERSASSSEIVAGALKELVGAEVVGQKTYGKGVVQSLRKLVSGGHIKLTTAEWFTPKGDRINQTGIAPTKICELKEPISGFKGIAKIDACLIKE